MLLNGGTDVRIYELQIDLAAGLAGLDVSVKETSACIVDDTGKIVREVRVASEPEALLAALASPAHHFKRIGLEAGPLSQWLFSAVEKDLPVICRRECLAGAQRGRTCGPPTAGSTVPRSGDAEVRRQRGRLSTGCGLPRTLWP